MFDSARLKIARATGFLVELDLTLAQFFEREPYRVECIFDEEQRIYGLHVGMTERIPPVTATIVGDIVHNLRTALEHVASDLYAAAAGEEARERSKFPMRRDQHDVERDVNGSWIREHFPNVADTILGEVCPWENGQRLIWACGRLWNVDKHRLPILSVGITSIEGLVATGEGITVGPNTVIVQEGAVVGLVAFPRPMRVQEVGRAEYFARFGGKEDLAGEEVYPTLRSMHAQVWRAVDEIERAYHRDRPAGAI